MKKPRSREAAKRLSFEATPLRIARLGQSSFSPSEQKQKMKKPWSREAAKRLSFEATLLRIARLGRSSF